MEKISQTLAISITLIVAAAWLYYGYMSIHQPSLTQERTMEGERIGPKPLILSEDEWRKRLTPEQYEVLREKGTEPAYSGAYWDYKKEGIYVCVACELPLFSSETKYDSGTGWPSFWKPIDPLHILLEEDYTFFTVRTEVLCARCRSHLGHVFNDGPPPTGLRYCMNSITLKFMPKGKQ